MGTKLDIPSVFTPSDAPALKRDLERFATAVDSYARAGAPSAFVAAPQPATRSTVLAFGMVTRVSLASGDTLALQLPQPDVANAGKFIYVKQEAITGTCTIRGVGALINGRATKLLPAAPGLYTIYFDGANYYSSPQLAADWGG
jgi:hypothetical protein